MHKAGRGVPRNCAKAALWFQRSAEQEHVEAQARLGLMHVDGNGVPQDYAKAAYWTAKAAEQGNSAMQLMLSWMYQAGKGVPQNYVKAMQWYTRADEQANLEGDCNLIEQYVGKEEMQCYYLTIAQLLHEFAEHGDSKAQYSLGEMYENGKGVPQDYGKAMQWYKASAG
jgi:hypothetical protein